MEAGRTEGTGAATRPSAGGPPRAGGPGAPPVLRKYWKGWQKATGNGHRSGPGAQKKGRTSGPARKGREGVVRGLSVPAPAGYCGQTGQTGAEQEHGGGLGDGGGGRFDEEILCVQPTIDCVVISFGY